MNSNSKIDSPKSPFDISDEKYLLVRTKISLENPAAVQFTRTPSVVVCFGCIHPRKPLSSFHQSYLLTFLSLLEL